MYDYPALRNIMAILLIMAGAAGLAVLVLMFLTDINYAGASILVVGLSVLLELVWSIVDIVCGWMSLGSKGRSRAFRLTVIVQLFVFVAMFQIILAGICSIYFMNLCILAGAGIVIPELFILIICGTSKHRPKLR